MLRVGDYVASYVPSPERFEDLDPRFRLPPDLVSGVPWRATWGSRCSRSRPTRPRCVRRSERGGSTRARRSRSRRTPGDPSDGAGVRAGRSADPVLSDRPRPRRPAPLVRGVRPRAVPPADPARAVPARRLGRVAGPGVADGELGSGGAGSPRLPADRPGNLPTWTRWWRRAGSSTGQERKRLPEPGR